MFRRRSRFENRPFYLMKTYKDVDSIVVIWKIKGLCIPFQQSFPNSGWRALTHLAHPVAQHAFNEVCNYFMHDFAVQIDIENVDLQLLRENTWLKFRDSHVSKRLIRMIRKVLHMLGYSPGREGDWNPRLEISMIYVLNPYFGKITIQTLWERAYLAWFPDPLKKIHYHQRNEKNGFRPCSKAWEDLKMVGSIRKSICKTANKLLRTRQRIKITDEFADCRLSGRAPYWRMCIAALYLLNPMVIREEKPAFLLDIWEREYFGVSK